MNIRERLEQSTNSGPNRAVTTDHSAEAWGSLSVAQRMENQLQVSYATVCTCGASGQRVTQQELSAGTVPVCRFCNGAGVAPGDASRRAGVASQQLRKEIIMSPRQRAEQAQRAAEQKQFEENQ